MKRYILLFNLSLIFLFACQPPEIVEVDEYEGEGEEFCNCVLPLDGKVYEKEGRTFLWGGHEEETHFDITNWSLEAENLYDYGYTRETFHALTEPTYKRISDVAGDYKNDEKVIFMESDIGIKVYPYVLMKFHEVINERVDGKPVMIAYCFLADLAAVYSRTYCDQELTFALSGYTYGDGNVWDGKHGFVLWDRETESLWWPLIDRAVSGIMQKTTLEKHDKTKWGLSTWSQIQIDHPDAWVLQTDPGYESPESWPSLSEADMASCSQK